MALCPTPANAAGGGTVPLPTTMPRSKATPKTKAQNHEGTIRSIRTKSGIRYWAVVMLNGLTYYGPRCSTASDARAALWKKIAAEAAQEKRLQSGEQTLSTLAPTYLSGPPTAHRSENTNILARYAWAAVEPALGPLRPSEVDATVLHAAVAAVQANGDTRNRYQREIAAMLSHFGNTLDPPRFPSAPEPEIRILTVPEQKRLVAAAYLPRTRLAIELLLDTGLRPSEACGLQHEDMDGDGFWVKRARPMVGSRPQTTGTKTSQSQAWVPLTKRLAKQLGPPRSGFVLGGEGGKPWTTANLRRAIKAAATDAKLGDVSPNELRHTAAVTMLAAGVDPATVATITRHSLTTLLKIYYRGSNELKRLAILKMQKHTG